MNNVLLEDRIYVTQPLLPELSEFNEHLKDIWDSKCLTNMGSKHNELESKLREVLKVPYVSLFNNGTIALLTAIKAMDLPLMEQVIICMFLKALLI